MPCMRINDDHQVTQVATPTGNITSQYDPTTHNLIAQTDLNGNTTQYAYDPTTGALTTVNQVAAGGNAEITELTASAARPS